MGFGWEARQANVPPELATPVSGCDRDVPAKKEVLEALRSADSHTSRLQYWLWVFERAIRSGVVGAGRNRAGWATFGVC